MNMGYITTMKKILIVLLTMFCSPVGGVDYQKRNFTLLEGQDEFRLVGLNLQSRKTRAFRLLLPSKVFGSGKKIDNICPQYNTHGFHNVGSKKLDAVLGGVLKGKGDEFIKVARKYDICPVFFAAVSIHETGNGSSEHARFKRNVFGLYNSRSKQFYSFSTVEESIEFAGSRLAGSIYRGRGLTTISSIQRVYCPIKATNDPKGVNRHWTPGVIKWMSEINEA